MPYRVINTTIIDRFSHVTDGTISIIQSANEPFKKRLIDKYCGRLSTWEASWLSAHHGAHTDDCVSPAPTLSAFVTDSAAENTPDKTSDSHRRSVSAINKVLERYNLGRKRRLQ